MATIDMTADSNRCFGRLKARELTPSEIEQVAGGVTYTGVTNVEYLYKADGDTIADDVKFDYADVE